MRRRHLALHRLLRRALPRRIREQRGADMDRTFLHMLEHDDRGRARIWAAEIRDLLTTGIVLRRRSASRPWRLRFGASWLDLKLGMRMLAKHPGLTVVAVFALAVGIPIGLAPWHLINAIEGPLPVEEGDRVVLARHWNEATHRVDATRIDDFVYWRDVVDGFDALAATRRALYNVTAGSDIVQPIRGAEVTASAFDVLRVPPLHGRAIVAADEVPGAPDVVVIGHDLWRARFNADPEAVGASLRLGGKLHTIVGVMPAGFFFPVRESLWLPLRERPADVPFEGLPLIVFGRLADGVSAAQAQSGLEPVVRRMGAEYPSSHEHLRGEVVPFTLMLMSAPAGGIRAQLGFYVVQMLTVLLLVVACTNVAMLIFARTATRSSELAVRATLGAGRAQVVWQMFAESLVLALAAGGLGLLAFDQGLRYLQRWGGGGLPYWIDLGVSWDTAARALALAVLSAVVAGVVPALKVAGKGLQRSMQGDSVALSGIRFGGTSTVLIVGDIALAVGIIALAGAGLENLAAMDSRDALGIAADEFLSVQLRLPGSEPAADAGASDRRVFQARVAATQQALVERLAAEPGVNGVAIGTGLPRMDHPGRRVELEGEAVDDEFRGHVVQTAQVDVGFFDALDQPILLGRGFDSRDIGENRARVIVNTTFVDDALEGRDPIGRRLRFMSPPGREPGPWLEIVGVVGRLGMNMIMPGQDAGLYQAMAPGEMHPLLLGIHVGEDPTSFVPRLRQLVAEIDANAVVVSPAALDEMMTDDLVALYSMTWGGSLAVAVLVLLAASGTYAIMSFSVAARTREIGIRTSLGARRRDVVRTISGRAIAQLGVGAFIGSMVVWRFLFLLQRDAGWIPTHSPLAIALLTGVGVVVLIGMPACMAPTLRALRIMPTEAMRNG